MLSQIIRRTGTVSLLIVLMAGTSPVLAQSATMIDGPAGKLPLYESEGAVGFSIYNGAVSRWAQHDIPNLTACLATYAPKVKLISADPRGDAATQMSQVQSMLVQDIDVLLITPVALT
ncbi:MAG: hypothetical protein JKY99_00795, partial [Rhizobiales bacterium]|nr:hypothetical protein [Hyphomicrobiales bacterium]